jgi:hypothetical protein
MDKRQHQHCFVSAHFVNLSWELKAHFNGGKPVPNDDGAEACSGKLIENETIAED